MLSIIKKEITVKKPREPVKTTVPPVKTRTTTTTTTTTTTAKKKNDSTTAKNLDETNQRMKSLSKSPQSTSKQDTGKPKMQKKVSSASSSSTETTTTTFSKTASKKPKSNDKTITLKSRKRKAAKPNNSKTRKNVNIDDKSVATTAAVTAKTTTVKSPNNSSDSTNSIQILKKSTPAKKNSKQKSLQGIEERQAAISEATDGKINNEENIQNSENREAKQNGKEENEEESSIDDFKESILTHKPPILTKKSIGELASLLDDNQILPVEMQSGQFEELKEGEQKQHNVGGRSVYRHRNSICLYKEGFGPGRAIENDQPFVTKNGRPVFHLALNESTVSFLDNSRNTSANNFLEMSSGLLPYHPKSKYNFKISLDDTNDMSETAAMLKEYMFDGNNVWNSSRTEPNHQEQQQQQQQPPQSKVPALNLSLFSNQLGNNNTTDESIDHNNSFIIPSTQTTDRTFFQNNAGGRTSTRLSFLYNKNTGIICKNCFSSTCYHMEKFSILATQNVNKLIDNSEGLIDANSSDVTPSRSTSRSEPSLTTYDQEKYSQEFISPLESIEELKELFSNCPAGTNNGNESMRLVEIQECSHADQSGNVIPFQELQVELEMNFETSTPNDEITDKSLSTGLDLSDSALLYTPAAMKPDNISMYSRPTTNETLQYDSDYDDASYLNDCKRGSSSAANSTFEQLDLTTGVFFCNSQNNSSSEDIMDTSYDQLSQSDIPSSSFSNSSDNRRPKKPNNKGPKRKLSIISNLDTVFEGEETSARSVLSIAFAGKNIDMSGLAELLETVDDQLSSRSKDSDRPAFNQENLQNKNKDSASSKDMTTNKEHQQTYNETENAGNTEREERNCERNTKKHCDTDCNSNTENENMSNKETQHERQDFKPEDFTRDSLDDEKEVKAVEEGGDTKKESHRKSQENGPLSQNWVESVQAKKDPQNAKEFPPVHSDEYDGFKKQQIQAEKEHHDKQEHEPACDVKGGIQSKTQATDASAAEEKPPRSFRRIQDKDEEILQYLGEDELQLWLQANRKNCFEKDFFQDDLQYNNNEEYNNMELLPEDREVLEINTPEWEKQLQKKSVGAEDDANSILDTENGSSAKKAQKHLEAAGNTSDDNPGTGNTNSSAGPVTQGSYRHIDLLVIDRPDDNINGIIDDLQHEIDTESNHSDGEESAIDSGVHSTTTTVHSGRLTLTEESDDISRIDGVVHHEIDTLVLTGRTAQSIVDEPEVLYTPQRDRAVTLPTIDSIRLAKKRDEYKNTRSRYSDSSDNKSIPDTAEKFSYLDYPREITSPMLEHHKKMAQYHRERIELLTPLVHGRDSASPEILQPKPPNTPPHLKKSHKRKFAKSNSPPTPLPPPAAPHIHGYYDNLSYLDKLNSISPRTKPFVPRPPPSFERSKQRFERRKLHNSYTQPLQKNQYGNPYYDEPDYQDQVTRINARAYHINKQRQLMRRQIHTYTKTIDPKYDTTLYLTVPFRSLNMKQNPNNIYSQSNRPSL